SLGHGSRGEGIVNGSGGSQDDLWSTAGTVGECRPYRDLGKRHWERVVVSGRSESCLSSSSGLRGVAFGASRNDWSAKYPASAARSFSCETGGGLDVLGGAHPGSTARLRCSVQLASVYRLSSMWVIPLSRQPSSVTDIEGRGFRVVDSTVSPRTCSRPLVWFVGRRYRFA